MNRFWHPMADMGLVAERGELVIDRGEGAYVFDEDGRRYLDATASLWYCNVGYGREEIAEAAARQLRKLPVYHAYGDVATRPVLELAERVASLFPVEGAAVYFTSGGGEAVDSAIKLARGYWSRVGKPQRTVVIARDRAYHGLNGLGTSLAGSDVFREGVGPVAGDVEHVAWDSAAALREAIDRLGAERVAAFICEPVIGAGGVYAVPPEYLVEVQAVCHETGVLLILDEVITGFGRLGDWFASNRFGLQPDLATFAKGITSGYVQLGGFIASPRVQEPFWKSGGGGVWRHGYTYSGHTTAAAAGLANLDVIERDGLVDQVARLEGELVEALAPLTEHELVAEIRAGTGLLAAVQLTDPSAADRVVAEARDRGILTRGLLGGSLQVSPPFVVTRADLDDLATGFQAALDSVAARLAAA